jgi:hypothetical protein
VRCGGDVAHGRVAKNREPCLGQDQTNCRAKLNNFLDRALSIPTEDISMAETRVKEHMEVIGADGAHIGTVDRVENGRIKLTKADSGEGRHKGHHHYIDLSLVADVEGSKVRLSANAAVAVTMEEEA